MTKALISAVKFTFCAAVAFTLLGGCSAGLDELSEAQSPPAVTVTADATARPALAVVAVDVVPDPEALTESEENPYSLLDPDRLDVSSINCDLYNAVYHAVQNFEPALDASLFGLSRIDMINLIGSLDVNFRLFN